MSMNQQEVEWLRRVEQQVQELIKRVGPQPPVADTLESLQEEARALIQQVLDTWGPRQAGVPLHQSPFHEYHTAYARWVSEAPALDVAWGLLANAYGGDWNHATDLWRLSAHEWERRWHLFEKEQARKIGQESAAASIPRWAFAQDPGFYRHPDGEWVKYADIQWSTPVVQAAVIAGQGEQLQQIRAIFGIPTDMNLVETLQRFYNHTVRTRDHQTNEIDRLKVALETEREVSKKLQASHDAVIAGQLDAANTALAQGVQDIQKLQASHDAAMKELLFLRKEGMTVDETLDKMKIPSCKNGGIQGRISRLCEAAILVQQYRSITEIITRRSP